MDCTVNKRRTMRHSLAYKMVSSTFEVVDKRRGCVWMPPIWTGMLPLNGDAVFPLCRRWRHLQRMGPASSSCLCRDHRSFVALLRNIYSNLNCAVWSFASLACFHDNMENFALCTRRCRLMLNVSPDCFELPSLLKRCNCRVASRSVFVLYLQDYFDDIMIYGAIICLNWLLSVIEKY